MILAQSVAGTDSEVMLGLVQDTGTIWRLLKSVCEPHLGSSWGRSFGGCFAAYTCRLTTPCLPTGPASRKMHYYRYSNAEVSCWYKYLLFSYNIVFWVSPREQPSSPALSFVQWIAFFMHCQLARPAVRLWGRRRAGRTAPA